GNKELAELLIDKGADINAKNNWGWTALVWAVSVGRTEVAEFLISKGADVNITDQWGQTTLVIAQQRGNTEIIELLRKHGAEDAEPPTNPLHEAAEAGDIEQIKQLISEGAEIDLRDNRGNTPLYNAAANGRLEVAELLIENGADVNAGTPLQAACESGNKELAELLIDKGADVNAKNIFPLHGAVGVGASRFLVFTSAPLTISNSAMSVLLV
ncbi:ankyrin repeat domain-containing protein, partial [Planctomycetota bacterium]